MDTLLPFALLCFTSFFTLTNPLGTMPVFLTMTKGMDDEERRHIVKRATIISFITLLAFTFSGQFLFKFFGISTNGFRIAAGFIILKIGYDMLQARFTNTKLKNKEIKKIILSRPAVEAGEKLGFLPGDMKDKIDPYLQPLYDALQDMIPAAKLKEYMELNIIQIAPLAFMRGRTLNDAVVILDEAQNTTTAQIKMFLTRMGMNTKMIVTGDMTQIDLPSSQTSGLVQALKILKGVKGISFIELNKKDIVRHKLVTQIVEAYEKFEKEQKAERERQKEEKKCQTTNTNQNT